MIPRIIQQALFRGGSLESASPGFQETWLPELQRLVAGFGEPGPEVECPAALLCTRLGKGQVVIGSVLPAPPGSPVTIRFLILARSLYELLHDPFAIAERFPPERTGNSTLLELEWPEEYLPERTLEKLDGILRGGQGPLLLPTTQCLVDGGKVALQRENPEPKLFRDIWALLPDSNRRILSLATYAYTPSLGVDLLGMPQLPANGIPGYLSEPRIYDYPDSRYERALQSAIENGDHVSLRRLLARRHSSDILRMTIWLAIGMMLISVGMRIAMRG